MYTKHLVLLLVTGVAFLFSRKAGIGLSVRFGGALGCTCHMPAMPHGFLKGVRCRKLAERNLVAPGVVRHRIRAGQGQREAGLECSAAVLRHNRRPGLHNRIQ